MVRGLAVARVEVAEVKEAVGFGCRGEAEPTAFADRLESHSGE